MSIWIELNEGTAARRRVPCRVFLSDGTSPDTGALGDAVIMGTNSLATFSLASTLRGVNANNGMYCVELSQSECSVLGTHPLYHTVGDFPQHIATIQVVNHNHFSTLSAISNVTIHAGTYSTVTVRIEGVDYSGLTIKGVTNYANISNVTLHAGTHSNVTIQGVSRLNSAVTLNADTHSGATIQGVTRLNSAATIRDAEYSAVTVRLGLVDYSGATIGAGNIAPAVYSGVSVEVKSSGIVAGSLAAGTLTSAKFASGAIDAVALATDAGQEIADRILLRGMAGGNDSDRSVGQCLAPLRSRTEIDGSTLTVYNLDDSTSMWTASVTTGLHPLTGIDPLGP
jgi:hypothetical protein